MPLSPETSHARFKTPASLRYGVTPAIAFAVSKTETILLNCSPRLFPSNVLSWLPLGPPSRPLAYVSVHRLAAEGTIVDVSFAAAER